MAESESIAADLRADGQPMTLERITPGELDPITGTFGTPIVQQWTVYGITANYNSASMTASQGQIQTGDKKAIIEATFAPQINDTLQIMGTKWRVVAVDDLSPQGETLLYTCQVRR